MSDFLFDLLGTAGILLGGILVGVVIGNSIERVVTNSGYELSKQSCSTFGGVEELKFSPSRLIAVCKDGTKILIGD